MSGFAIQYLSLVRLRCAGFSFARLGAMNSDELLTAPLLAAQAERATIAQRAQLLSLVGKHDGRAARDFERKTRSFAVLRADAVAFRAPPPQPLVEALESYQRSAAALAVARDHVEHTLEAAFARARTGLRGLARDGRFREAVGLMSPASDAEIGRLLERPMGPRVKSDRHAEAMLWLYAQRLCAKNDTNSFYGPVVWGNLDPSHPAVVHVELTDQPLSRRVFFERWPVADLARAASADPAVRPWLRPSWSPNVRLEGNALHHPVGRRSALPESTAAVMALCDGTRTLQQIISERAAAGQPEDDVREDLEALVEAKALRIALPLPTGEPEPELSLARALDELGAPAASWRAALDELQALRAKAEAADWPERGGIYQQAATRLAEITGGAARRGEGQMYAGRGVFHEDARRDASLVLGQGFVQALAPLQTLLAIYRIVAHSMAAAYRRRYLEVLAALPQDHSGADLLVFLSAAQAVETSGEAEAEVLSDIRNRWQGLRACGSLEVVWSPEHLQSLLERLGAFTPVRGFFAGNFHSPDVLVAAADADAVSRGDFAVVLGEVHASWMTLLAAGGLPFCPDPQRLARELSEGLPSPLLRPVEPERTYHARRQVFPVRDFALQELDWDEGAPPRVAPANVRRAADLRVRARDGELYLTTHDDAQSWDFFSVLEASVVNSVMNLQLPLSEEADQRPRIRCEKVVLQRRLWTLQRPLFAEKLTGNLSGALLRQLAALRADCGLPARVYCKDPGETKPVLVDFSNPVSVEHFVRLAQQPGPLAVSEELPGPNQLFLFDPIENGPLTSEFRLTARFL